MQYTPARRTCLPANREELANFFSRFPRKTKKLIARTIVNDETVESKNDRSSIVSVRDNRLQVTFGILVRTINADASCTSARLFESTLQCTILQLSNSVKEKKKKTFARSTSPTTLDSLRLKFEWLPILVVGPFLFRFFLFQNVPNRKSRVSTPDAAQIRTF